MNINRNVGVRVWGRFYFCGWEEGWGSDYLGSNNVERFGGDNFMSKLKHLMNN
jgi:hypothetical protein